VVERLPSKHKALRSPVSPKTDKKPTKSLKSKVTKAFLNVYTILKTTDTHYNMGNFQNT
jgi:hypothetical protein